MMPNPENSINLGMLIFKVFKINSLFTSSYLFFRFDESHRFYSLFYETRQEINCGLERGLRNSAAAQTPHKGWREWGPAGLECGAR
jgi:hypothetical protein